MINDVSRADMAELADAPDLGSGVYDVQVQVLLSADISGEYRFITDFSVVKRYSPFILKYYRYRSSVCIFPSQVTAITA